MNVPISLNGVSRTYPNGTKALENFSLALQLGEKVSLIGPSGCGKSTVLRLLAGLDKPDTGSVSCPADQKVGYVFQDATLLPWARVFENVFLPFKLQGIPRSEVKETITSMLERMDLADFADAYPNELSGGMKMRVSIARALIGQPQLLLLDEPFAALDEITRFRLNDLLLELQARDGFSLLFVTHSVFESVYLSDRVAVMTSRPGCVSSQVATVNPGLTGEDYRASASYTTSCADVSAALRNAMNE